MNFVVNVDLVVEAETKKEANEKIEKFFESVIDNISLIEIYEVEKE